MNHGKRALEIAAQTLQNLAENLDSNFERVIQVLVGTKGRIILTGIGKSGLIGRKIAATFASTGTPALYLHPADAIHGDLGVVLQEDAVIAISNSGETEELLRLFEFIKRQGAQLIAITGNRNSTLARFSDCALTFSVKEEGCPLNLAPMASTTASLALGDAIAASLMDARGFTSQEFARFHPGGKLGKKLLLVKDAISRHVEPPLVPAETTLSTALFEISEKRLGMTAVQLPDQKIGMVSDGDIRRLLQAHGDLALHMKVGEVCTPDPKSICEDQLAVEALHIMEQHKITAIIVLDSEGCYKGVVHLHDLWRTQLV